MTAFRLVFVTVFMPCVLGYLIYEAVVSPRHTDVVYYTLLSIIYTPVVISNLVGLFRKGKTK